MFNSSGGCKLLEHKPDDKPPSSAEAKNVELYLHLLLCFNSMLFNIKTAFTIFIMLCDLRNFEGRVYVRGMLD